MAHVLFFGVIAVNLICVLTKKNSKFIAILSVIALSLVMGFAQSSSGDLSSYRSSYEASLVVENSRFESGYMFINTFFRRLNFSFDEFRIAIFLISMLLIFLMVRKFKPQYNLLILLYTLSIFYFFSVALRFFVGYAFVMLAFYFLLKEKKYNILLYVGVVLLAAQFHKSLIVCLLFLLCFLPARALKTVNITLLSLSFLSMVTIFMMILVPSTISGVASFINSFASDVFTDLESMSDMYFRGSYSRRYVIYVIFYILNCLCTYIGAKYMVERGHMSLNESRKIVCVQLILLVMSPTVLLSQTMMRLMFIALTLGFVVTARFANIYAKESFSIPCGNVSITKNTYIFISICSALTWFVMLYLIGDLGFNLMNFLDRNTL